MFYYHQARSALPDRYADVERFQQSLMDIKVVMGIDRITYAIRRLGHILKAVQRLMQELNLKSFVRPKRYRSYRGQVGRIAENVLQRNFHVDAPDKKW